MDDIEKIAAAIWEAMVDPRMKRPGMTWPQLLDALDGNPSSWAECHERCLRQARAVLNIAVIPDPEDAEMVEFVAHAIFISKGRDPDAPRWVVFPGGEGTGICWHENKAFASIAIAALRDRIKP